MKSISIQISGTTPLLCNKFTDKSMEPKGGNKSHPGGDKGSPHEQAEAKLYGDASNPYVPGPNMFRSIVDGGTFFKVGKSKVTTMKNSMIVSSVEMVELELPLVHKDPWTVDSRSVVNPATRGRMMCHRPKFNDWQLNFTLVVDETEFNTKLLREVVDMAGRKIGLGDYRPDRKGPFGRYVVTKWVETDKKVVGQPVV